MRIRSVFGGLETLVLELSCDCVCDTLSFAISLGVGVVRQALQVAVVFQPHNSDPLC